MKLRNLTSLALNFALIAFVIWRETEAFREFQADSPGAGVWAFMSDRGPFYLAVVIGVAAIFVLAAWLESLPTADADKTEFHEKETI